MNSAVVILFRTVLKLSLVGSYAILLVLVARLLLRKAPRWCSYLLWGIVFLRLSCPVFPEAAFSLIPTELEQISNNTFDTLPAGWVPDRGQTLAVNDKSGTENLWTGSEEADLQQQSLTDNAEISFANQNNSDCEKIAAGKQSDTQSVKENELRNVLWVPSHIWFVVALLLACYHIYSYWNLKRKVRGAVEIAPDVREIKGEHLSFVMGILHPSIYLSSGLDEDSRRVVLCHEQVHLQRKDYLVKPVALGICCIHWFNPMVWLAFYLMNKDCEMSCDEKVVSRLGEDSKKIYSYALLDEATKGMRRNYRKGSVCMLLSFGEDNVKNRIRHVLHYKKASLWMVVAAVVVVVVLLVGLCSNPGDEPLTEEMAVTAVKEALTQKEKVEEKGVPEYVENMHTVCFLRDYEGDGKPEAFVQIGEYIAEDKRIKGDLWFVSETGEAILVIGDKSFEEEAEFLRFPKEQFIFVSYVDFCVDSYADYLHGEDLQAENEDEETLQAVRANQTQTESYGVRNATFQRMIGGTEEKYLKDGNIVMVQADYELQYDVTEQTFSGYGYKKYTYEYADNSFRAHAGYEIDREEITHYVNGQEILKELEARYPEGRFQYIARENGWIHFNVAYEKNGIVYFEHVTYEDTGNALEYLEEGKGCYRRNVEAAGEVPFTRAIAKEYGYDTENELAVYQTTPSKALFCFANAFMDRNGDILYKLSADKDNFAKWDMVIPLENGGYAFGDSSPWVTEYDIEYEEGSDEAVIRFILSDSAPEYYIAKEKVKLTRQGELYYVDHVEYKFYEEIDSRAELAEIYDLEAAISFPNTQTGYYASFGRIIFQHIWKGTNPEYYNVYHDPVTAAKKLLHLGEGTGEVTEVIYHAMNQFPVNPTEYGEGSVVNVRYTFSEDGSTVDIPMVLSEESEYVWLLSVADLSQIGNQGIGELPGDNARIVHAEYSDYDGDGIWENSRIGDFIDRGSNYQISDYGVYCLGYDMKCIYPHYIYMSGHLPVDFCEGKMYFPTDADYVEGADNWVPDSICVIDTGTNEVSHIPIPEEGQTFLIDYIRVDEGFITLWNQNGGNYAFPLEDTEAVWNDKKAVDLSGRRNRSEGLV